MIKKSETLNPDCDWKFVRGPLTRQKLIECGGNCPELYCDPALFLPEIQPESKKEYDIGIVPHYADYDKVSKNYGHKYKIINVNNINPLIVAQEITKCKKIISGNEYVSSAENVGFFYRNIIP